jgi:hypothetical protein
MDSRAFTPGVKSGRLALALPFLFAAACGSSAQVKDDRLVRLPAEDRQALLDEQQTVTVAKANLDSASAAVGEAQQFRAIVGQERKAAKSRDDAVKKDLEMSQRSGDPERIATSKQRQQAALEMKTLTNSKGEYAENLLRLRQAQRDMRQAEYELSKAKLENAEYEALQARGMAEGMKGSNFAQKQAEKERDFAVKSERVNELEGITDASKSAWEQAQARVQESADQMKFEETPIGSPPPPEPLEQPAAKEQTEEQKQEILQEEQQELREAEQIDKQTEKSIEKSEKKQKKRQQQQEMDEELQQQQFKSPPKGDVPDTQGRQGPDETDMP